MLVGVQIELRYFGILKDLLGHEVELMQIVEGARVEDVIRLLRGRASNCHEEIWATMAVAVNLAFAPVSTVLKEADEVAFLPPVSGGGTETIR